MSFGTSLIAHPRKLWEKDVNAKNKNMSWSKWAITFISKQERSHHCLTYKSRQSLYKPFLHPSEVPSWNCSVSLKDGFRPRGHRGEGDALTLSPQSCKVHWGESAMPRLAVLRHRHAHVVLHQGHHTDLCKHLCWVWDPDLAHRALLYTVRRYCWQMGTQQPGDLEVKYWTMCLVVHFAGLQVWIAFFGVMVSQNQHVSSVHLLQVLRLSHQPCRDKERREM